MRIFTPVLLALVTTGCVDNAVLELELSLPQGPMIADGMTCATDADCGTTPGLACASDSGTCVVREFILVQPRKSADSPFTDVWAGGNDLEPVQLEPGMPVVDLISVLTQDIDTDVNLKVSFCTTSTCTALEDADAPQVWFQLEHPFYQGRRTTVKLMITDIPIASDTAPRLVERCQIRGCVDGELSSYCRVDGRHLCE